MKKVLCYGDSNTYGFNPADGSRYDKNIRWTGILQQIVGQKFQIIEAGCNNRTAFTDSLDGPKQTGYKNIVNHLIADLSYVVLALGINDLQKFYTTDKNDIESGIQNLIQIIKSKCPNSQILIVAPSKLKSNILDSYFACQFDETSIEKSLWLAPIYKKIAEDNNCKFLDLNEIVETSSIDGLHYEPYKHKQIAQKIYEFLN